MEEMKKLRIAPPPEVLGIIRVDCMRSFAFTLAEVLITLGIIGVVAALTIPSVITKYKRQTASTKLEKFYSVMNQAIRLSIAEHGDIYINNENKANASNAAYIEKWYKEYITKYIKHIKEEGAEKDQAYYKVALADGTGFNSYMGGSSSTTGKSNLYIFFCLNYSNCDNGSYDGKNSFAFAYNPEKKEINPIYKGSSTDRLKSSCYSTNAGSRHGCAALIQSNNWEIPEDYPWIR